MSNHYRVGFELKFIAGEGEPFNLDQVTNQFYDELLNTEDRSPEIIDPDIAAHLDECTASVELTVAADHFIDAQVVGATAVRTALHVIGLGTPGWEAVIAGIIALSPMELQDV
jgi:hypothetical protein